MPKLKVIVSDEEPEEEEPAGQVRAEELRLLEAMLFASAEPLDEKSLAEWLPQDIDVHAALLRLREDYATRGVNLVRIGGELRVLGPRAASLTLATGKAGERQPPRAAPHRVPITALPPTQTRAVREEKP